MRFRGFAIATVLASLTALVPTAGAEVVMLDPTSVTSAMGSLSSGGYADLPNLINQSGLSSPYTSGVTNFTSYTNTTTALGGDQYTWTAAQGYVTGNVDFYLGGTYTLDALSLWTLAGAAQTISVKQFTLLASNSSTFSTYTTLGTYTATEPGINSTSVSAQVFDFTATSASYIRIEIQSNYGNMNYSGMGEVAFGAVIPEPSSLALCGIAGVVGLVVARFRRRSK
jgi:hypothetical protein